MRGEERSCAAALKHVLLFDLWRVVSALALVECVWSQASVAQPLMIWVAAVVPVEKQIMSE